MIMRQIDRSRSTGGGMALSFGLHATLLLLLGLLIGRQAAVMDSGEDLTEIAYIEAKYGEDVAAKVKIKQKPVRTPRPEPPGAGVNTDSAFKPKANADTAAPRPATRPAEIPAPRTAQLPQLKRMVAPVAKPSKAMVANVDVAPPLVPATGQPKVLATAQTMVAKTPRPKARQVIDPKRLGNSAQTLKTAELSGTVAATSSSREMFQPQAAGLKSRTGTVVAGNDVIAQSSSTARRNPAVVEAQGGAVAGGTLRSATGNSYQAPRSGLVPSSGNRHQSASAVMDVDGPAGGGGGAKHGRKTILNYGSGGGGRGGGLSSRQRLAEPQAAEVVSHASNSSQTRQAVAEVQLEAKGVNMSITGQIQGRKILKSAPAEYSDQAKRQGWEGVVAVHFTVLADGRVKDNLFFQQTSVHRDLNQAAMAAIRKFQFAPLGADQAAVEQWGVITIVFKLN